MARTKNDDVSLMEDDLAAAFLGGDEDIMDYVARRNAEDDWKAEAADVLEDN